MLQRKFGRQGFRVVAVNAWDEPNKVIRKFVRENDLPYTVLVDGNELFTGSYKGRQIPHNYLLDHEGKIIHTHLGWNDQDLPELEELIQEALDERDKALAARS